MFRLIWYLTVLAACAQSLSLPRRFSQAASRSSVVPAVPADEGGTFLLQLQADVQERWDPFYIQADVQERWDPFYSLKDAFPGDNSAASSGNQTKHAWKWTPPNVDPNVTWTDCNTIEGGALADMTVEEFESLRSGAMLERALNSNRLIAERGQLCLDDTMCVTGQSQLLQSHARTEVKGKFSAMQVQPACSQKLPEGERLILHPLAAAFHGSTGLEQMLMSSPNVSTLCAALTWQCEGSWLYTGDRNVLKDRGQLEIQSKFWNLQKPAFMDKDPASLKAVYNVSIKPYWNSKITWEMRQLGITKLTSVFVLMWRPICLQNLSKHEYSAHFEYQALKKILDVHKVLTSLGHPTLIVNLGDVLFNRELSEWRLSAFLPCLGTFDSDFVPALGKDIFSCNRWKASGSIAAYADAIDSAAYGYNVATGECQGDANLYDSFHGPEYRGAAKEAVEKLLALSRTRI